MKGPSIAVMLGGAHQGDGKEDEGETGLSEAKARGEDAATAFASAIDGGNPKKILRAFRSLYTLACHLDELEDSGETDDEDKDDKADDAADEAAEE